MSVWLDDRAQEGWVSCVSVSSVDLTLIGTGPGETLRGGAGGQAGRRVGGRSVVESLKKRLEMDRVRRNEWDGMGWIDSTDQRCVC
jgi:hypothetical protein